MKMNNLINTTADLKDFSTGKIFPSVHPQMWSIVIYFLVYFAYQYIAIKMLDIIIVFLVQVCLLRDYDVLIDVVTCDLNNKLDISCCVQVSLILRTIIITKASVQNCNF